MKGGGEKKDSDDITSFWSLNLISLLFIYITILEKV